MYAALLVYTIFSLVLAVFSTQDISCASFTDTNLIMLDYILYQFTPGGTVVRQVAPSEGSEDSAVTCELLGVIANGEGVFEVKAKGEMSAANPDQPEYLLLPIKGSKQMSLRLPIQKVEPLITPLGAWSATCQGPAQKEFLLKAMDINCDNCQQPSHLEFVVFSGDDNQDALAAMNYLGWRASMEKQVCPKCIKGQGVDE